ncbi:hypothetical protein OIO90_004414 [Microbotryomycetes sp. JL221]|nr:hypothetical protein OIO90_004414 [Microbotryomycetes sp. JL221]
MTPTFDLTGLSDDDAFQTEADWLNDVLNGVVTSSSTTLAALDQILNHTLIQLDTATHDTSILVDRTIDDISRSVPRLAFDLQLMRENALLLHFTLTSLRKRSESGADKHSEVTKVMDKLKVLDLAKSRMEASRDVLREAESWSTLESEVTGLVVEHQYAKAAERLEEAARSMVVFQNTAEFEARRALMVSLQNQLEASLSTPLVTAIANRDIKACKLFHVIFRQIQREAEFTAYYFGSRRAKLVDTWSSIQLHETPENEVPEHSSGDGQVDDHVHFTTFLSRFFGDLLSLLQEERSYIPAIFSNAASTLAAFAQTTLEGLSPPFSQRLSGVVNHYGRKALPELISAFRTAEEFGLAFDRLLTQMEVAPATSPLSPGATAEVVAPNSLGKSSRRHTHRLSASKRLSSRSISFLTGQAPDMANFGQDTLQPWETALFEPFLDWQIGFANLERNFLNFEAENASRHRDVLAFLSLDSSSNESKLFGEAIMGLFASIEDSFGRALALTHGYAAAELVRVIDEHVSVFLEKYRLQVVNAGKTRLRMQASKHLTDSDDTAFGGLDYSTEDWNTVQQGLKLLGTCRTLKEKLTGYETKLRSRLAILAQTVRQARDVPGYTIPGTTKGGLQILRQSSLNSADLASLLKSFEAEETQVASTAMLPRANQATVAFFRATQVFLHDVILAPLLAHVSDYASLPVWSVAGEPGSKGFNDLSIPTFSLSPTEAITRVGEGLFNLPRLFEVYAEDDALGFSIETLPHVDVEALRIAQDGQDAFESARTGSHRMTESISGHSPSSTALHRTSSQSRSLSNFVAAHNTPAITQTQIQLNPEAVIATWLSSLTLSVLKHIGDVVLPSLQRLTRHGASQLVSDLDYVTNVAKALDVEPPEELESWRQAAALDKLEDAGSSNIDGRILDRMARIRGWRRVGGNQQTLER